MKENNGNNEHKLRRGIILITYAILLYLGLNNLGMFMEWLKVLYRILVPFVYAFAIAYLLNKPYMFFRDKAFARLGKDGTKAAKLRKPLAMLCSYLIGFMIIAFLVIILVPALIDSANQLTTNFSSYAQSFEAFLTKTMKRFNIEVNMNSGLFQTINELTAKVTGGDLMDVISTVAKTFLPTVFDVTKNVTTALYNWLISIIVSIYMMVSKEQLLRQSRKVIYAVMPKKTHGFIAEVATLSHKMIGRFVYGKIIDSAIIGLICYIGMLILKFDYPLIISVIVGVTNIIPFFGPFIGAIPSCILLLMINPLEAVWFAIFVLVLQQIDGNIIGAKILGATIGISDFWIMFSILLGGGLFGVVGMILGCPIFAVIYILIGRAVNNKLSREGLTEIAEKTFSENSRRNE